jgi:hypothetical protein
MKIDTKSRHRTKVGGNVFTDLGFPPKETKRLLAHADAQVDESIRLKQQLMDEISEWMKGASVTPARGRGSASRHAASGLRRGQSQGRKVHQ